MAPWLPDSSPGKSDLLCPRLSTSSLSRESASRCHNVNLSTSSILDIADLLTRVDDDHELLVELFFIFRSVFPAHLQSLADAINVGDVKEVQTESHTLKGMLLNLAAPRASAVASRLEEMGREKQLGGMKEALAAFQVEVELLLTQMEECVNGLRR